MPAIAGVLTVLGALAGAVPAAFGEPVADLRYWSAPQTGLAIGGYDPVAYFTDRAARPGDAAFEATYAGAVWHFANEGNRAVFLADPQVYAPRLGGYSPPALARGVAVAGNPLIWTVYEDRLYLFHSPVHKTLWDQDRDRVLAAAQANWPAVRARLPR